MCYYTKLSSSNSKSIMLKAEYFVFTGEVSNQAYEPKNKKINILFKSGKIQNIDMVSDQLNLKPLSKTVTKYYICYPKE